MKTALAMDDDDGDRPDRPQATHVFLVLTTLTGQTTSTSCNTLAPRSDGTSVASTTTLTWYQRR